MEVEGWKASPLGCHWNYLTDKIRLNAHNNAISKPSNKFWWLYKKQQRKELFVVDLLDVSLS